MSQLTLERRRLRRAERTFDGGKPVGEVYEYKRLRERLALAGGPPRYLARLASGMWLPGLFIARHDAAETLRAHCRLEEYEDRDLSEEPFSS
jgi:hypothetical protein